MGGALCLFDCLRKPRAFAALFRAKCAGAAAAPLAIIILFLMAFSAGAQSPSHSNQLPDAAPAADQNPNLELMRTCAFERDAAAGIAACTKVIDSKKSANIGDDQLANALYYRGKQFARQNSTDLAIADFDAALLIRPKDWESFRGRGYAKQSIGNLQGALADLVVAAEYIKTDIELLIAATYCAIETQQFTIALRFSKDAIKLNRRDFRPRINLGIAYSGIGDHEMALKVYEEAMTPPVRASKSQVARILSAKARIFLLKREFERAEELFSKSIALNPNDENSYLGRAAALSELGKQPEAQSDREKVFELRKTPY